jgi:hypothetical protein
MIEILHLTDEDSRSTSPTLVIGVPHKSVRPGHVLRRAELPTDGGKPHELTSNSVWDDDHRGTDLNPGPKPVRKGHSGGRARSFSLYIVEHSGTGISSQIGHAQLGDSEGGVSVVPCRTIRTYFRR